jgi:hypothetical protein
MDSKQYAFFKIDDAELQKNQKVKNRLYNCVCSDENNILTVFDPRGKYITQTLYTVLNYDKTVICFDEPLKTRQCRSVILSYPENKLLSFSPPKSITSSEFKKRYPNADNEDIYINEQIEGTLLHLFYDARIDSWEIATKKAVGGNYRTFYYKNPKIQKASIRNMFLQALAIPQNANFQDIDILKHLSKDYSYCFVLQHPENHIVFSIEKPALYLIAVYDILPVSKRVISIPPLMYETWRSFENMGIIQFPRRININNYEEVEKYYENRTDYTSMGLVITNLHNGEHFTIKNPIYANVTGCPKSFMNSLQYQYLCFYHMGKTSEFLEHFPKYKSEFDYFYKQRKEFIDQLHDFYMTKYVWKLRTHLLNEDKYEHIADVLHKIHLQSLSKHSQIIIKITKLFISEFLSEKSPEEMIFLLNYDLRRISNPTQE